MVWLRHMECACYFGERPMSFPKREAGIFQMQSAESLATSEVPEGSGYGTWNVPATLESDEYAFRKSSRHFPNAVRRIASNI
jgi:hypothetical protein